jgi:pimeloyl-ACP methyl ester carboxylesterase
VTQQDASANPGSVRRRHVIYVQGYDPRGLAEYYRMFRGEYRKFCALYGLTGTIGKIAKSEKTDDPFTTTWPLATSGAGWQVDTTYEFLRWDDIIRADFTQSAWLKTYNALITLFWLIVDGTLAKFTRFNWRFTCFVLYAYAVLISHLLVSALCGLVIDRIASVFMPSPWPLAAGIVTFAALVFWLITRTEQRTYMLYMFNDITSTYRYAHRRRPDWEQRFDLFAQSVVDAVKTTAADEVVIIGHSSGSFVAIDVLARALDRDPKLGEHGPGVALMTVGSNIPTAGFQPGADWYRKKLAQIAVAPAVDWVDFQSRKDVMNFFAFDPIAAHGIDVGAARRNPTVVPVRFRDIVTPQNYPRFRWRFFELHFQFLRANQRRGVAYDYFMICCGPFDLMTRATRPAEVLAATGLETGLKPPDLTA